MNGKGIVSLLKVILTCVILLLAFFPFGFQKGFQKAMVGFAQTEPERPIRIIFLHHSCGENLINEGGVREGLTGLGYEFYDHGYNGDGLRLADGSYAGFDFDVPDDNTDPDGLANIFAQPLHDPPDNTFSHLMAYDVIAFKSCFPVSNIADDQQLAEYQRYYLFIRDRIDQYPHKLFIVVTQPPQVPGSSDLEEARRARALADWLRSDEFLAGHPNLATFDFFGLLAGEDNFLRAEYRYDDYDAHPNPQANAAIGPQFVAFLDRAIRNFAPLASQPESQPTPQLFQPTATPGQSSPTEPPPVSGAPIEGLSLVDDFEAGDTVWDVSVDESGSSLTCAPSADAAHSGAMALQLTYRLSPGGWADCGRSFETLQDWSAGAGLSLFLQGAGPQAIDSLTLMVFAGDPDAPTPFQVEIALPSGSDLGWRQVGFSWDAFALAPWADADGLSALDPTHIVGYAFNLSGGEETLEGTLWVDDVHVSGEAGAPLETTPLPTPGVEETVPAEEGGPVVPTATPGGEATGGKLCGGAPLALLPVVGSAIAWQAWQAWHTRPTRQRARDRRRR